MSTPAVTEMAKPVDILVTGRAVAVLRQLDSAQRAQFDRLIAALRLSPQAGVYYAHDGDGRPLYQVSSYHGHVIYTIVYRMQRDQIFIIAIEVADWTPQHVDMP
jgi:hypothetical protein